MSSTDAAETGVCCANCGAVEVDDVKLEDCDGCDLVKYCSDKCRVDHREQHDEECRKREAELYDRKLFTRCSNIMSKTEEAEADVCCANCGIAEVDDIKLEVCPDCDLVKYCGDKCRGNHRVEEHEEECRKHNKLFRQPDGTHDGECPICFLPLPLDKTKSGLWTCCSEIICMGCKYAHLKSNGGDRCPFCREPAVSKEEAHKRVMERVEAGDPAAMNFMGTECYREGDYDGAFEYWTKAAELGDAGAHYELGLLLGKGHDVEMDDVFEMDDEKAITRFLERPIYHFKIAAIGGHPSLDTHLPFLRRAMERLKEQ